MDAATASIPQDSISTTEDTSDAEMSEAGASSSSSYETEDCDPSFEDAYIVWSCEPSRIILKRFEIQ